MRLLLRLRLAIEKIAAILWEPNRDWQSCPPPPREPYDFPCDGKKNTSDCDAIRDIFRKIASPLTLQPLLFWKKQGKPTKKARVFLFAEPLESLGKKGKTHQKSKEHRKTKKVRKSKKARIGGSGPTAVWLATGTFATEKRGNCDCEFFGALSSGTTGCLARFQMQVPLGPVFSSSWSRQTSCRTRFQMEWPLGQVFRRWPSASTGCLARSQLRS